MIIGTLFKEMEMKPCILKNLMGVLGSKKFVNYVTENDYAVLEDSSGRIRIRNNATFDCRNFITGTIIALR